MSRTRLRAVLTLLVGIALVASACGDDDDGTTSTTGGGGNAGTLQFTPYDAGGPLTEAALKSGAPFSPACDV